MNLDVSYLPSDPPRQKETGYEQFHRDHASRAPEFYTHTQFLLYTVNTVY